MGLAGVLTFRDSDAVAECATRAAHLGCRVLSAAVVGRDCQIRVEMDQATANRTAIAAYEEGFVMAPVANGAVAVDE